MPLVGLSGTPGVGKTSAARILEKKGCAVIYLTDLIEANPGFVTGYDRRRKTKEVDASKIRRFIKREYSRAFKKQPVLVDSHYAYLLGVDFNIVLRCSPDELGRRLARKKYAKDKKRENIESEVLDVITIESVAALGKDKVYEIDTTHKTPDAVARAVLEIIRMGGNKKAVRKYGTGRIDWSSEVLKWY